VLEIGDEVMACLNALAGEQSLSAAQITAIGAFNSAVVTYFDWGTNQYLEISVSEQAEVASMNGDIGLDEEGKPSLHIHLVFGKRDGSAIAGHLEKGHVRST
jgi:predicted DNA-binding protein with PD1-like motif